jgi:hypothetical protein
MKSYLIQWFGWLALLGLFYWWLGIPEARVAQLALSAGLALLILAGAWLLMALAFDDNLARAKWFLGWYAALILFFAAWWWTAAQTDRAGPWLASLLTWNVKKPFSPASARLLYAWIVCGIGTLAVLGAFVPWAAQWSAARSVRYWLRSLGAAIVGGGLAWTLYHWVPELTSTAAQVASFAVRATLAWSLAIGAWWVIVREAKAATPSPSPATPSDPPAGS